MNYPVWELPLLGGGLLIAIMAVVHVFISHFAVGGGLFLVLWERRARKTEDPALLAYVKRHSRFFILVTLVAGALTGVGIWFVIQLIHPTGTSALIHNYVWGWAIEWVFFFVEIAAALLYYYTWDRVDARTHMRYGWIYFVAAYLSLVVINGIITFMLTPGAWLETPTFWAGFFNPTYWPSLLFRTGIAIGLAGIYAMLTLSRQRDRQLRERAVRRAGVWVLAGFAIVALNLPWYLAQLPVETRSLLAGQWPTVDQYMLWGRLFTGAIVLITLLFAMIRPRLMNLGVAILLALLGLGQFGSFEMIRELIRKPYIITGKLYSHSLYVDEVAAARAAGLVSYARWVDPSAQADAIAHGREVYKLACSSCHSLANYRGLAGSLVGYDAPRLRALLRAPEEMRWRMPPFPGNAADAEALLAFLAPRMSPAPSDEDSRQLFRRHCYACHDLRGEFRPLADMLEGFDAAEMAEVIEMIGDDDGISMPAFTGSQEDRARLSQWLAEELAPVSEGGTS